MKPKLKVAIPIIFLAVNFLFVILSFKSSPFSNVLNEHDSTMFMYFGKAMNNGMTPYVDMFDHKGIVLFWIQQIGVSIGFGNFSTGIWIIEILFYLVTLVFLYKTCMAITENKIASSFSIMLLTGAMVIPFSGGNYSEEFALSFIAVAGYLFTKILVHEKQSKVSLVLIGITGALTFFIRSNMVALWLVFVFILFLRAFEKRTSNFFLKELCIYSLVVF